MQIPDRMLRAIQPSEHPGLLLATAYGAAVLSVGPFVLPALAAEYEVGLGVASMATTGQLAGFAAGSFGAGRFLRPRGRILGVALAVTLVANALSAVLPPLVLLLVLRVVSGVGLGIITWFSWSQVFGNERRMGTVGSIGPLVGITTAPVAAVLLDEFGLRGIFVALATTAAVPLVFSRRSGSADPAYFASVMTRGQHHSPTPDATKVLGCLGLLTLGGSAVFTFGAVIAGRETSLSLTSVSLAYSANALASIPSARWRRRRGSPGLWLAGCAVCATLVGASPFDAVFVGAIVAWGFLFWMGVPGAYALLARSSRHPEERAGDAQAIMAVGRVIGPLAGGVILEATSTTALGLAGGGCMLVAAGGLVVVDRHRPPSR